MVRCHTEGTRRRFLTAVGGAAIGLTISGTANAQEETLVANVGYSEESGRQAALDLALDVEREYVFDALTIIIDPTDVEPLQQRPDIRYVEEEFIYEAIAQETPWGVERVGAPEAHEASETGDGASIAIIDTGIDATHADLEANLGKGAALIAEVENPVWQDDNGHGTHCAGIAAAVDDDGGVVGVSPDATLHAVKVLTAAGTGLTSDVAAGIEWTADQNFDVGSLSLGGGESELLRDACEYANEQGVLLVAAAGNDGPCEDCVSFPAAYEECLAVSATDQDDDLASFSSTGDEIELAAPGADIRSTYLGGTYTTLSGTSMACPHVSAAGGMLMADDATNTEARQDLKDSAEDIGLQSTEQGNGLLDVPSALGIDS